jgi:hypothetical protein
MKAQDLRIGNLVYGVSDRIETVSAIYGDNRIQTHIPQLAESYYEEDVALFEPIPLSEDILLRLGFEKVKSDYEEAETYDFYLGIIYFNMANTSTKISGKYCLSFIPDYVHQLQNLYFALTGTELTFKQ